MVGIYAPSTGPELWESEGIQSWQTEAHLCYAIVMVG